MKEKESDESRPVCEAAFKQFINANHPCLMARTVVRLNHIDCHVYKEFGTEETAGLLIQDIENYIAEYDFDSPDMYSFCGNF